MMKRPFPFLPALVAVLLLAPSPAGADGHGASVDYAASPVWGDLVVKEGDGFHLSVPAAWRDLGRVSGTVTLYFEASGRILPVTHDGGPVIVTVFLTDFPAASLEDATTDVIEGYAMNPDRVFPDGFSHEAEPLAVDGAGEAALVNTRFYRKSKGLNQSRFDLVAFSPASRRAFLYTLSVQYADPSYALEERFQMKSIARKLFGYFQLR